MTNPISKWLHRKHEDEAKTATLEKVQPQHPEEYPARHLKEILDGRRGEPWHRASQPTGMPDGPGLGG